MKESKFDTKVANAVRGLLHVKEKLEHIDKIERDITGDSFIVTYTSHESDDGWQYDSEQNTIKISADVVNFYNT